MRSSLLRWNRNEWMLSISLPNEKREYFYKHEGNQTVTIIIIIIIIIMSLRLSARWGQPFTGSDFSMPVDLVQGGTSHVHCADTILLCHLAILCMDAPFEIFRPFYQILDVLLAYSRPFCRCGQITLVSSSWWCLLWSLPLISFSWYLRFVPYLAN